MSEVRKCAWALKTPIEEKYHDEEWGRPCHDEKRLFQMLVLEGQQAGLSWVTILKKREAILKAFDDLDPQKVAAYGPEKAEALMQTEGIIKNRLKINAAITNAKAYHKLVEQHGSLDAFLWGYVNNKPIKNSWREMSQIPANTPLSDKISEDLKRLGFKFVGSTIIYALMQSIGMVNDHLVGCSCYDKWD